MIVYPFKSSICMFFSEKVYRTMCMPKIYFGLNPRNPREIRDREFNFSEAMATYS